MSGRALKGGGNLTLTNVLEPSPCTFDLDYVHEIKGRIFEAQKRGQRVILLFAQSPPWANGDKEPSFPPTKPHYWAYANALKRLYRILIAPKGQEAIRRDTILAVEVWNEPNSVDFWPTHGVRPGAWVLVDVRAAKEYADLLSITYSTLKCEYPHLVVLGGSLASCDTLYLDALYSRWGKIPPFDALSLHPYTRVDEREGPHYAKAQYPDQCNTEDPLSPPWCFKAGIEAIYALMAAKGNGGKSIWITEFGTGSSDEWGDAGSEQEQAEHLRRALDVLYHWWVHNSAINIPVAIFYRLKDEPLDGDFFGLVRKDYSLKPAALLLRSRLDQDGRLMPQQVNYKATSIGRGGYSKANILRLLLKDLIPIRPTL